MQTPLTYQSVITAAKATVTEPENKDFLLGSVAQRCATTSNVLHDLILATKALRDELEGIYDESEDSPTRSLGEPLDSINHAIAVAVASSIYRTDNPKTESKP